MQRENVAKAFIVMPRGRLVQETFEGRRIPDLGQTFRVSLEATAQDHDRPYDLLNEIAAAGSTGELA